MACILDYSTLREFFSGSANPRDTLDRVTQLCDLARWWVRPNVLREWVSLLEEDGSGEWKRFLDPPRVRGERGACWVIFANEDPDRLPFLRPAFLIPFQWVKGVPMDPHLPEGIAGLATSIADNRDANQEDRWGLKLASYDGFDRWDMRRLNAEQLPCGSGWASLAAGLFAAKEGGDPDPQVWASASWVTNSGAVGVGLLEPKIDLAAEFGARHFFVAKADLERAKSHIAGYNQPDIEVCPLEASTESPRKALLDYLKKLKVPPGLDDTLDDRWAHYESDGLEGKEADEYLRRFLLDAIVEECRKKLSQRYNEPPPRVGCLVTIANNTTLVMTTVKTLSPERCVLLHTPGEHDRAVEASEEMMEALPGLRQPKFIKLIEFKSEESMLEDIAADLDKYIADFDETLVAYDVTPGTKLMSITLATSKARATNMLIYLRHQQLSHSSKKVKRGYHEYFIWRADQGFHA